MKLLSKLDKTSLQASFYTKLFWGAVIIEMFFFLYLPQVCREIPAVWTIGLPSPHGETQERPVQLPFSWVAGSPLPSVGEMGLQSSQVLMCKRKEKIYKVEVYSGFEVLLSSLDQALTASGGAFWCPPVFQLEVLPPKRRSRQSSIWQECEILTEVESIKLNF